MLLVWVRKHQFYGFCMCKSNQTKTKFYPLQFHFETWISVFYFFKKRNHFLAHVCMLDHSSNLNRQNLVQPGNYAYAWHSKFHFSHKQNLKCYCWRHSTLTLNFDSRFTTLNRLNINILFIAYFSFQYFKISFSCFPIYVINLLIFFI